MARSYIPAALIPSPAPRMLLPKRGTMIGGGSDIAPFNAWFDQMFPEAVRQWGSGFLESRHQGVDGFTVYTPCELNTDAWAAALGGRKEIGTQVVFLPPEQQFYFLDYRAGGVGAFCPVSEHKLQLLVSNYLMRCADACDRSVEVQPLFSASRKTESLKAITDKAKTILEVDRSFFAGPQGKRRMIDGRVIEANTPPAHVTFIKTSVVSKPEAKLMVTDAFHRYHRFCKDVGEPPLTRAEFKSVVKEVIREEFRLGLRHDILDERGKSQEGWLGLDLQVCGNN
jgi:hypothetical protein